MPGPADLSPKLSPTTALAPLHSPHPPQARAQPAAPRRSLEGIAHRTFDLQGAGRPETASLASEQRDIAAFIRQVPFDPKDLAFEATWHCVMARINGLTGATPLSLCAAKAGLYKQLDHKASDAILDGYSDELIEAAGEVAVAIGKRREMVKDELEELIAAADQTGAAHRSPEVRVAAESPQDKRCLLAEPVAFIAQAHRPADTPDERLKAAMGVLAEGTERAAKFGTLIEGQGMLVRPPAREDVTARHVSSVLADMARAAPGLPLRGLTPGSMAQPCDLYIAGVANIREAVAPGSPALRFGPGIKLTQKGRELLATYYARKYNADIAFSATHDVGKRALNPGFIEAARQKPGDVVRCAQYVGHLADNHGTLLVYMREAGEESLLWFDSMSNSNDLGVGIKLAKTAAPHVLNGKPITVFQYAMPLQRDWQSCWVYAMKTAVTLTGHERDRHGGFGDFMIPDLVADMEARRLKTPTPAGANPVWAPPEVAKTSQIFTSVLAHAGDSMDVQLRGAKPGVTLRSFLEKYTYTKRDGDQVMDYMRQKNERLAEIVEIQAWSQEIGKALDPEVWGIAQQNEFATRMKALVRGKADFSDEGPFEELQLLADDPAPFIKQELNG